MHRHNDENKIITTDVFLLETLQKIMMPILCIHSVYKYLIV